MNTLESAISMPRVMPEADARGIFEMKKSFLRIKNTPFAAVGRQQILRDADASVRQIKEEKTAKAADTIGELRTKYDLHGRNDPAGKGTA